MSAPQPKRPATIAEAAERYGVCTVTIRRYIKDGRITGYRTGPRLLRVDLDELDYKLFRAIPAAPPMEPMAPRARARTAAPAATFRPAPGATSRPAAPPASRSAAPGTGRRSS